MFQEGTIVDSNTYDRLLSEATRKAEERNNLAIHRARNSDEKVETEEIRSSNGSVNEERTAEIQQLSQIMIAEQPTDDEMAQFILAELNLALDRPNIITSLATNTANTQQQQSQLVASNLATQQRPYPPVNQTGLVADHDRPYADYGHLDRQTLAREAQFDLQLPSNEQAIRLNTKSFAITAWSNVSKELVLDEIKRRFGIRSIQYICICEEISDASRQRHLHIQIILKEKVNLKKRFLDQITNTRCNYQVTQNDLAWNEYIKKELNFIEFGDFKSLKARGQTQWPSLATAAASDVPIRSIPAAPAASNHPQALAPRTTRATTVRAQAAARRQQSDETARKAMTLARTSISAAMDFLMEDRPNEFLSRSTW